MVVIVCRDIDDVASASMKSDHYLYLYIYAVSYYTVKQMLDGKPDDVNLKMLNERTMDKLKSSYDKEKRWVGC